MRTLLGCGLAVVLALAAGVTADAQDDKKIDGKKLVGKWEPKGDKADGKFVVEFTRDGKTTLTGTGGKDFKAEGTYKLDGNKLTLKLKLGDDEKEMTRTVLKLTDTELVSKDENGKEDTLARVKEKDKK